jgi:hypothetical protein
MSLRDPLYLGRGRKRLVQVIGIAVWLSGCAWLGLHYFAQQQTEFGPAPHPAEHWTLMAHGLFAFAALWAFGLLWSGHIAAAWKSGRHRVTGSALFLAMAALIVSGYLLYYAGSDTVRPLLSLAHWAIGLALPAAYGWHRAIRRIKR